MSTETINTLNSTYEVDWDTNRIRRIHGTNEPTTNQSADGEWQQAESLHKMAVPGGRVLYMVWNTDKATISSLILEDGAA